MYESNRSNHHLFLTFALLALALWGTFSFIFLKAHMHAIAALVDPLDAPVSFLYTRERIHAMIVTQAVPASDLVLGSQELSHITDVAYLYRLVHLTISLLALFSWAYVLYALTTQKNFASALYRAGIMLRGVSLILFSLLLLFPVTFSLFHRVLFPQGNWEFPASSPLIQAFPASFWMLELGTIVIVFAVFSISYLRLSNPQTPDTV